MTQTRPQLVLPRTRTHWNRFRLGFGRQDPDGWSVVVGQEIGAHVRHTIFTCDGYEDCDYVHACSIHNHSPEIIIISVVVVVVAISLDQNVWSPAPPSLCPRKAACELPGQRIHRCDNVRGALFIRWRTRVHVSPVVFRTCRKAKLSGIWPVPNGVTNPSSGARDIRVRTDGSWALQFVRILLRSEEWACNAHGCCPLLPSTHPIPRELQSANLAIFCLT